MSQSFNNQEQLAANTYDVLQRTGASLQRSNQIAFETEQIGTEVRTIHIHLNILKRSLFNTAQAQKFCTE